MARVGVVVVTWNSAATVGACLRSIPAGVDVVVVDNASTDASCAVVREALPEAQLLVSDRNLGFGAACNLAARHLAGHELLLLNPDAILLPGTIERLVAALDEDPALGIVGPCITDDRGRLELSWGDDPTLLAEWRRRREHGRPPAIEALEPLRVDWVTGACCLVRRSAWEAVRGFDEGYFLYFEDLDLCRRIRHQGWTIGFEPQGRASHVRGVSARALGIVTAERYRASQRRYYRLHLSRAEWRGLRLYQILKYVWALLRDPDHAASHARIIWHALVGHEVPAIAETRGA